MSHHGSMMGAHIYEFHTNLWFNRKFIAKRNKRDVIRGWIGWHIAYLPLAFASHITPWRRSQVSRLSRIARPEIHTLNRKIMLSFPLSPLWYVRDVVVACTHTHAHTRSHKWRALLHSSSAYPPNSFKSHQLSHFTDIVIISFQRFFLAQKMFIVAVGTRDDIAAAKNTHTHADTHKRSAHLHRQRKSFQSLLQRKRQQQSQIKYRIWEYTWLESRHTHT